MLRPPIVIPLMSYIVDVMSSCRDSSHISSVSLHLYPRLFPSVGCSPVWLLSLYDHRSKLFSFLELWMKFYLHSLFPGNLGSLLFLSAVFSSCVHTGQTGSHRRCAVVYRLHSPVGSQIIPLLACDRWTYNCLLYFLAVVCFPGKYHWGPGCVPMPRG